MDELLSEFVAETREMMEAVAGELVAWEADPSDRARLDAIFRFVHTVKGNCGFFDFPRLEGLSHAAETALSEVRAGRRDAGSSLVSAVLAVVDAIKAMMDAIEAGTPPPSLDDAALIAALDPTPEETIATGSAHPASDDRKSAVQGAASVQRTIRLPIDLLDRIMAGVSDLVLARNDLSRKVLEHDDTGALHGSFDRLSAQLDDVRDAVTRMRMQRVDHLYSAFPRLVRDLAAELGKQVMIDLDGGDVELDREMIEMVRDPFVHLLRNAIDHGIEPPSERRAAGKREIGLLTVRARQSGNRITIDVTDDGRGLDRDRIASKALSSGLVTSAELSRMDDAAILDLVFEPGFSTAAEISTVSGRGVGMDVVRSNLSAIGGSVQISSDRGEGTTVSVQVPLTLSILSALIVRDGSQRFAIPLSHVEQIVPPKVARDNLAEAGDRQVFLHEGKRIPAMDLAEILGTDRGSDTGAARKVILVRSSGGTDFALLVDQVLDQEDLVVKPLPPVIMQIGHYAGTTLLDDGSIVLMLDTARIAARYGLGAVTKERSASPAKNAVHNHVPGREVMVFAALDTTVMAIPMALVSRIEVVEAAAVDLKPNSANVVIGSRLLPVFGIVDGDEISPRMIFILASDGHAEIAIAVGKLGDTRTIGFDVRPLPDESFFEGLALIDDRPVTILDGHALLSELAVDRSRGSHMVCRLPEGHEWAQTVLAPLLRSAGYRLVSDRDAEADVCFVMTDMSDEDLETDRRTPVIRLSEEGHAGTDGAIPRYDRGAILAALAEVAGRKLA
ncbi:chemotaxis protein CheA [Qipengyuania sp. JC766]|uniref:chemotaxis protein CheA n=1 Tax=Qipengyuania sp. JC766 TaxID=3232139 RepID=UPI00345950E4